MSETENSFGNRENEIEWNEALSRLRAYLRALNPADELHQEKVVQHVIKAAAAKKQEQPSETLTALAMAELHAAMARWFEMVLGSPERATIRGILALSTLAMTEKWPSVFLESEVPQDFQKMLRQSDVRAAPDLSKSTMVPQPFPNPLSEITLPAPPGELARELAPLVSKVFLAMFLLLGLSPAV
jgi:hypothetical protein